jgi:hypothetical protein
MHLRYESVANTFLNLAMVSQSAFQVKMARVELALILFSLL